jgi:hypothetical protein
MEDLTVTLTDLHAYRKYRNWPSSTGETVFRFARTRWPISRIVVPIQGDICPWIIRSNISVSVMALSLTFPSYND